MKKTIEPLQTKHKKKIVNDIHHIGCSGYYYPNWKNKFYPPKLKPKEWLHYYSTVFNTVELNGTFYRTPSINQLNKYYEQTPDEFLFAVKMSKYITHVLKLQESKQQISEFQDLITSGLKEKTGCFLFQLPPSFVFSEENLERVVENIPHSKENIVEFRHISWWNDQTIKSLRAAGITFCNVDFPGMKTSFEHTTDYFYLRLHGNPVLFKSAYTTAQLKKFYKQFPKQSKQYWVFFNNTYYEAGYTNALELVGLVS